MPNVRIKITGDKKILKRLNTIGSDLRNRTEAEIKFSLEDIKAIAQKSMKRTRKGRARVRYLPRRLHRASLVNNPPAIDTGHLVNHITWEYNAGKFGGNIGTNILYGRYLEISLKRPWLKPAAEIGFQRLRGRLRKLKVI